MSSRRVERVSQSMRETLAQLLLREIKDPRVRMVTVSRVDLSPDLRNARVYYGCLGDTEAREQAQRGLESAAGFLRGQLSRQLHLRYAPELRFHFDDGFEHAEHVARLLRGADDRGESS